MRRNIHPHWYRSLHRKWVALFVRVLFISFASEISRLGVGAGDEWCNIVGMPAVLRWEGPLRSSRACPATSSMPMLGTCHRQNQPLCVRVHFADKCAVRHFSRARQYRFLFGSKHIMQCWDRIHQRFVRAACTTTPYQQGEDRHQQYLALVWANSKLVRYFEGLTHARILDYRCVRSRLARDSTIPPCSRTD